MGKENFSKIKLLKIWEILKQESDENHPLSTVELLARLKKCNITCDRRTLYQDIAALNHFGYEVIRKRGQHSNSYYTEDRSFDVPELRILIDAIQAASFITAKKTAELVDKIAALGGSNRAEILKRNIVEFNTTKHSNESIYYSINAIEDCIIAQKKISFNYFDLDKSGKRILRKDGERYVVNPVAMVFTNDNYYLVCYSDKYKNMTHYRIDRMDMVEVEAEDITLADCIREFDITKYKKQVFGMYVGKEERVSIVIDNSLIDPIMDKFGEDVKLADRGDGTAVLNISVQISPAFIAWCCSFGDKLKVTSPSDVVKKVIEFIDSVKRRYVNPKESMGCD